MIINFVATRPEDGFRYTHDVFWNGHHVAEATEVQYSKEEDFDWCCFVTFVNSPESKEALSSPDVEAACDYWDPSGKIHCIPPGILTAQPVVLRGEAHGGSFTVVLKEEFVPIPDIEQPSDDDLADIQSFRPNVIAW